MGNNGSEGWAMVKRSGWTGALAQSLKAAAVVMVLGWAILAAEQRLAQEVSPEEIVAAEAASAFVAASAAPTPASPVVAAEPARTASR